MSSMAGQLGVWCPLYSTCIHIHNSGVSVKRGFIVYIIVDSIIVSIGCGFIFYRVKYIFVYTCSCE